MKKLKIAFLVLISIFVSSCLTVEKKNYKFEFTSSNSGKLTITYINIFSQMDDSVDVSENDYDELINDYIVGTKIEDAYPLAFNVQKRLYEYDGKLNAEVTMEFNTIDAVRLYKFSKKSPIAFNLSQTIDSETFESTNGTLANADYMNVIFWNPKTKVLEVTTKVSEFTEDDCFSLVKQYRSSKGN
ncbi:MAG: hypothetical protein GX259_08035 [Bacteroidales bacterium]|nr:hypothetical protein [Bacteroidales bacterium]